MIIFHFINSIIWGVAFAGLVHYLGFSGYYAGYSVGVFYVMYYLIGIDIIKPYAQRNN